MVPDRGIFVVADGMGGHAAGEVASEMAVRFVARDLGSLKGLSDDLVAERMRVSIRTANNAIFQRTLTEHDKRGMGTTVTALVLYDTRFLIGQVGDSRCYLLREGRLTQITKDHSYVQEQVDAGYLTPEQARAAHTRLTPFRSGTAIGRSVNTRSRRAVRYSSAATRGRPRWAAASPPDSWATLPSRRTSGRSRSSMAGLAGKSRNSSPGSR